MAFDINDFRSRLKFGGARTSLFRVLLTNPANGQGDIDFPFMCQAASLPGRTLGSLTSSYFGRATKYPGNTEFDDWQVTIKNDEDFKIRNALEEWANKINAFEGNINRFPTSAPENYKSGAQVDQYSQIGDVLRTYKFVGIWPKIIAPIEVSWDDEALQTFSVTFSVDYYFPEGQTGDAGGK